MQSSDPARIAASLDPVAVVAWKAISFFAAEPTRQREAIGPAGPWFVRERHDRPHANYVIGMAIVVLEHAGTLTESAPCVRGLLERFNARVADRTWTGWNADALDDAAAWGDTRRLARACLQELGLPENIPRKPLAIDELVEVETYAADTQRGRQ